MKKLLKTSALALTLACSFNALADTVYWNEPEAISRLSTAEYKADFPLLSVYYQPQENKMFCGVASAAIVLNALRVENKSSEIPLDSTKFATHERGYLPHNGGKAEHSNKTFKVWSPLFHRYTQNTVLVNSPKPRIEMLGKPKEGSDFKDYGLQLDQFTQLIESNGAKITSHELSNIDDIGAIKADMIKALKTPNQYLVVNYSRVGMQQNGGGHYAPVAAYDAETDSLLILDPNNADYLWHWADADMMIKAMHTVDVNNYRGYSVISD